MRQHVWTGSDDQRGAANAVRGTGRLIAGRYLLGRRLGSGGMGTVWQAHDQVLARDVAAKELHVFTQGDEDHRRWLRRALREARMVARVPHPHVVGVHDLVEHEDRLWIVMELVDGPSLGQLIAQEGALEPRRVAGIGAQLLGALEAVHAVGALHRDVKPANVLLRRDGGAVLTDFGIAVLEDGDAHSNSGEFAGSAEYMAPERVNGSEVGPASDLWSLGATLVTAATGRSPFHRPANVATLHAVAYEEPNLPPRLGPLLPVVEALLRKPSEERPSAADTLTALRRVADGAADPGPLPPATLVVRIPHEGPAADRGPAPALPEGPSPARHDSPVPRQDGSTAGAAGTALADEETLTRQHAPWADHAPPTSRYDARTAAALGRQDGGRRRGTLPRWSAFAGAVLLAGAGLALFLTGTPPFDRADRADRSGAGDRAGEGAADGAAGRSSGTPSPAAPVTTTSVVRSTEGWQRATGTPVEAGDTVTVRFTSGRWTVDDPEMPPTGPGGYDPATDRALDFAAADCKVDAEAPFGALLGRFVEGAQAGESRVVGDEWTFEAGAAGTLELRVNDADGDCLSDNSGDLEVTVTVE
ncbi:serine/threonine-protein kinase [Streptomyces fructofermentans]|uniref:serine/threonine-protein kinase n=1 Tax=Streptomyces fructofermentans TaxID=152141 RepID=UPI0033C988E5